MMSYVSNDYELGFLERADYELFAAEKFWEMYHDYRNSVRRKALAMGFGAEVKRLDDLAARIIEQIKNNWLSAIRGSDLRAFSGGTKSLAQRVLDAKEVETMYPGTTWDFFKQETAKDVEKAKSIGKFLIPVGLLAAAGFLIYSLRK